MSKLLCANVQTLSDSRIKKMMKQEGVKAVTGEASFVVARATVLTIAKCSSVLVPAKSTEQVFSGRYL